MHKKLSFNDENSWLSNRNKTKKMVIVHPDQQNTVHEFFINRCFPPFYSFRVGIVLCLFFSIVDFEIQNNMQKKKHPSDSTSKHHNRQTTECSMHFEKLKVRSIGCAVRWHRINQALIFPCWMDILVYFFPIE